MPDKVERPVRPVPPGLADAWAKPLSDFATLPATEIEPGLRERHGMYSLLTMAVVASQFNGNKHGDRGDYGAWRAGQVALEADAGRVYRGGTYLGHNIGAIAVDARGTIVDFDFNHNEVFNSSVEHAESRLVRRLFGLAQVFDPWRQAGVGIAPDADGAAGEAPRTFLFTADPVATQAAVAEAAPTQRGYGTLLADVSIYTSLESCAQCSGIMALASVREVAYLQYDQGQYLVGNLMFRGTRGIGQGSDRRAGAPHPIPGGAFDFAWYDRLNAANIEFAGRVAKEPFFRAGSFRDASGSVTSFLCTDQALEIYTDAARTLDAMSTTEQPAYRRPDHLGHAVEGALTNAEVLEAAKRFIAYVRSQGRRGTQHRV